MGQPLQTQRLPFKARLLKLVWSLIFLKTLKEDLSQYCSCTGKAPLLCLHETSFPLIIHTSLHIPKYKAHLLVRLQLNLLQCTITQIVKSIWLFQNRIHSKSQYYFYMGYIFEYSPLRLFITIINFLESLFLQNVYSLSRVNPAQFD